MEDTTSDWKNVVLSWNWKANLVKACLQAMPLYSMSCFKLPKGLCNKLTSLALNYWWDNGDKERSIHWINKETLQKDRKEGCLGFRSFDCLNDALLMKQL